ncbi:MAG: hypothetical protein AAGD11_17720 [Planctomycetota bacterium]
MRHLSQPETAEQLGQLFGGASRTTVASADLRTELPSSLSDQQGLAMLDIPTESDMAGVPERDAAPSAFQAKTADTLAAVRDNTYFRPAESKAWFGMFKRLLDGRRGQPVEDSFGELTYTQLLKQPDVYRGRVVTVRGVVRREELLRVPKNSLGLESYHRLWIEPVGGTDWPIVTYCLHLPEKFPRGDHLDAAVSVTGYFFKNWSYPWRDGLGIAPVVLSGEVSWTEPTTANAIAPKTRQSLPRTALIAGAIAAVAVYLTIRTTSFSRRSLASTPAAVSGGEDAEAQAIREQLQALAESESA